VWCAGDDWCPVTTTATLIGRKWRPVIVPGYSSKNVSTSRFSAFLRWLCRVADVMSRDSATSSAVDSRGQSK
jgi:DNA-binding HxlR family transcriptional regulator